MGFVLLAVAVAFLVPILILAPRAARRGRRFIGTEDPIEAYKDGVQSSWSYPYGSIFRVGTFGMGWRRRVRMQTQLDAERHEERLRRERQARRRDS